VPPIFEFLARAGEVADDEMLRAFNMGIGMIVACDEHNDAEVLALLTEHGGTGSVVIGRIGEGERGVAYV
jgi:phosphoribosylformylglycinamidine cyclo-ligase